MSGTPRLFLDYGQALQWRSVSEPDESQIHCGAKTPNLELTLQGRRGGEAWRGAPSMARSLLSHRSPLPSIPLNSRYCSPPLHPPT